MTNPLPDSCAHCGHPFRGDPIPDHERAEWWGLTHYPTCFGVENINIGRGALYWECPRCYYRWHHYHPAHPMFVAAEQFCAAVTPLTIDRR